MRNQWLMFCSVLVIAVGCGKDENNDSNTNNASNNASNVANNDNNTSNTPNNTSNDPNNESNEPNNTSNDPNNVNNTRTQPFVTRFSYYIEDDSIGASDGYTVSILSGDIANTSGNTRSMTTEDAEAFESTHMTDDLINKMRDGWGCPEPSGDDMGAGDMGADMDTGPGFQDDAQHIFEARILEGDTVTEIQDITGCVEAQVPEVMSLIEAINALGESYL